MNKSKTTGSLNVDSIQPCGYHVLIEMRKVEEKSAGGILLGQSEVNREQAAMPIGKILAFGPVCYKNHESGISSASEWGVAIGDYVQFPSHTYMKVAGKEHANLVYVLDYDIKGKVEINE